MADAFNYKVGSTDLKSMPITQHPSEAVKKSMQLGSVSFDKSTWRDPEERKTQLSHKKVQNWIHLQKLAYE